MLTLTLLENYLHFSYTGAIKHHTGHALGCCYNYLRLISYTFMGTSIRWHSEKIRTAVHAGKQPSMYFHVYLSYLCSGSCILVIMVKLTKSSTRASLSFRLLIGRLQPASSRYSQLTAMTSFSSSKDSASVIWNDSISILKLPIILFYTFLATVPSMKVCLVLTLVTWWVKCVSGVICVTLRGRLAG